MHDKSGVKIATLFGKWDEAMYYVNGDVTEKHKSYDPMSEAAQLWRRADPPERMTRYGLTAFSITLNELTPGLKVSTFPISCYVLPNEKISELFFLKSSGFLC